jgi:NAD(P)-dependent dehydrogenase (short-subunit alcohol dehydrogenase family)
MGAATPQIAYTASKGAVLAMTREMAMVHAREGIRVNALSPCARLSLLHLRLAESLPVCRGPLRTRKFLHSQDAASY